MDRYGNTIIKVNEDDFKKDFWGLGFLLKSFFFHKNSGEMQLIFPDNIDEILLNLVKSQKFTEANRNHAMYYTNIFTMKDGHICKNPIIKLIKKEIKPAFSIIRGDYGHTNMDLAFSDPNAVKIFKDLNTVTVDNIEYIITIEVILDENISNKFYKFLVYDIVDPICSKINSCELCDEALPFYHGFVGCRTLGHIYDGYDLLMEPKIQITDENPDYFIVTRGMRCYRIWMNENNDISMIQEIGGAKEIEYDSKITVDEFFEKYPHLKNDWKDVI